MNLRILAFSDLHRNRDAAAAILAASGDAQVVVGAGDFATLGQGLDDAFEVLLGIEVPLVIVAGNHDDIHELRKIVHGHGNVHLLHGSAVSISGVAFFGLGFEIGLNPGALPQSIMTEAEAATHLADCPLNSILVTHAPPFGVVDLQRDGSHQGSVAIRHCVESKKPALHLCGHIHNAWGTSGRIGDCAVHNLGPGIHMFDY